LSRRGNSRMPYHPSTKSPGTFCPFWANSVTTRRCAAPTACIRNIQRLVQLLRVDFCVRCLYRLDSDIPICTCTEGSMRGKYLLTSFTLYSLRSRNIRVNCPSGRYEDHMNETSIVISSWSLMHQVFWVVVSPSF
jgi:hypothetical protein